MRGITEKRLKSCLKNRVSLNMETIVKFLIMGTLAFSLTGCKIGGSGGGGGSSSGGDANGGTTEKDTIVSSSLTSEVNGATLVKGVNSNVKISKGVVLKVNHNNSIGAHITNSARTEAKLINEGKIEVLGNESIGILADNNATAINNGIINVVGSGNGMVLADGGQGINKGTIEVTSSWNEEKGNWERVNGIKTSGSGSLAINEIEGKILVKNSGVGMEAVENSTVINKGTIEIEGNYEYETDSEGNTIKEIWGSTGLLALSGSTAINEGYIKITGSSNNGMYGDGETTLENKGTIETKSKITNIDNSWFDSNGNFIEERGIGYSFECVIDGRGNSYIENSGTLLGEGSVLGIVARTGSTALNIGDILITGKVEKIESGKPLHNENSNHIVSYSEGMGARDKSTVTNEGNININGGNSTGVYAGQNSQGMNKGNITLESSQYLNTETMTDELGENYSEDRIEYTYLEGMRAWDSSEVENEGKINLKGTGSGIVVVENSNGLNKGEINLESVQYIQRENWIDSEGENHSEDRIEHTYLEGMKAYDKSEVINEGKINLKGSGIGIIASEKSKAVNEGDIYGESIVFLQKNWYTDSEGNLIENEELKETYIGGMESYDGSNVENNGKIELAGSGSGMEIRNNSNGINNGLIVMEGKNVIGANISDGEFVNSKTGIIEVKATEYMASGIYVSQNWNSSSDKSSKIENHGIVRVEKDNLTEDVDIYSGASVRGIDASGTRIYSEDGIVEKVIKVDVLNTGLVNVSGNKGIGISITDGDLINSGEIILEGKYTTALNISGEGKLINTSDLVASGIGISANSYNNSKIIIENEGNITVEGNGEIIKNSSGNYYSSLNAAIGIESNGGDIFNSADIIAKGNGVYLEYENDWGTSSQSAGAAKGIVASNVEKVENHGNITVEGNAQNSSYGVIGLEVSGKNNYDPTTGETVNTKAEILNSGNVNVIGDYSTGIKITNGDLINNGKITAEGDNSNGIYLYGNGSTATNNGIVNIDGNGSYGMYAGQGSTIVNGLEGVINVGATAAGGMYVDFGSTAINNGTINIHEDNIGGESIAMVGPGTLVNTGSITANTDLVFNTTTGGNYVIGSTESGTYGKISGKTVSMDGQVIVSSNITKNGFKDEYSMQNVVDAEELKLGENFELVSDSLLYDAEAVTDRWGNLDATLNRNDKVLSDFTKGYTTYTANIFGKYQNENDFKTLSADAKEVLKSIDTKTAESIEKSLNALTPTIYSNLGRQMLETSETFKVQDAIAIDSIGENSYNFTFLGEYRDVDSRKNIEGYESKLSGFVGAMSFGDGTYGTLGYGHNSIDYDDNGSGKIETIHLGLNRYATYSGLDLKLGLGGEYNFHENKRDIDSLNRKAESDFDSYGVRGSAEVSKKMGDKTYFKPFLGLDLAYMKYDEFSETGANSINTKIESQKYTSLLPKVGTTLGLNFDKLSLYSSVEYSYELGDMEKDIDFSYEGFDGVSKLEKDELECGTTSLKAGANYKINSFTVGASIGKNFGKRDNMFGNVSLGYTF